MLPDYEISITCHKGNQTNARWKWLSCPAFSLNARWNKKSKQIKKNQHRSCLLRSILYIIVMQYIMSSTSAQKLHDSYQIWSSPANNSRKNSHHLQISKYPLLVRHENGGQDLNQANLDKKVARINLQSKRTGTLTEQVSEGGALPRSWNKKS